MLWPFVLPLKITFYLMTGLVALLTVCAPIMKWKRATVFAYSTSVACIAFIPSCTGIKELIDAHRFGVFHYESFTEVQDMRIERFLPPKSRDITLEKNAMRHRAKYSLSEPDLKAYLDEQWDKYGEYSASSRDQLRDGESVSAEEFADIFGDLGWPPPRNITQMHSPMEADGGGATYYFEPGSGTVFHRAGYW
jgi:hypothetical protein